VAHQRPSRDYQNAYSAGDRVRTKPGIYAANADLSGERQIFEGYGLSFFSPDGGRIAVQGGEDLRDERGRQRHYAIDTGISCLSPVDTGPIAAATVVTAACG
jgi:hypothetical protein